MRRHAGPFREGPHEWLISLQLSNIDLKPVKSGWNSNMGQRGVFTDLMCIIHPKLPPLVVKI